MPVAWNPTEMDFIVTVMSINKINKIQWKKEHNDETGCYWINNGQNENLSSALYVIIQSTVCWV